MDLAASVQAVLDEIVLRLTRSIAAETGARKLCLAGGVALNCVANGKVLRDGRFDELWIQPASGDAGGALGAALAAYYYHLGEPRHIGEAQRASAATRTVEGTAGGAPPSRGGGTAVAELRTTANGGGMDSMRGAYLGPSFPQVEIERRLCAAGARFNTLNDDELIETCAKALIEGKALGWFQGRMEFGPRALGGRSILGDARSPKMQSLLNLKVKYRESFRPFAPSVLREHVSEWFELDGDSPYMLLVADVVVHRRRAMTEEEQKLFGIAKLNVPRSDIPAVTHVDYSARIQTVHKETNPRYHALLSRFRAYTGCPVIVNTSFNVRGEPIVCTPEDAFRCFMGTEIEALAVGNCYLRKEDQDPSLKQNYEHKFELD
jgi:carbamoyltransferase